MIYELYKKSLVLRTQSKKELKRVIDILKDKDIEFEEVEVLEYCDDNLIPNNPIKLTETLGEFGKKRKL